MTTTWKTVTLERARIAVRLYNNGTYGCLKNPDLDQQALDMFADGIGSTAGKILRQVEFIGREYGGVAPVFFLFPEVSVDSDRNSGYCRNVFSFTIATTKSAFWSNHFHPKIRNPRKHSLDAWQSRLGADLHPEYKRPAEAILGGATTEFQNG